MNQCERLSLPEYDVTPPWTMETLISEVPHEAENAVEVRQSVQRGDGMEKLMLGDEKGEAEEKTGQTSRPANVTYDP